MNRPKLDGWRVKLGVAAAAIAFIAFIAVIDYMTNNQTAITLFYAVTIVAVVWLSWGYVAILAALLCGTLGCAIAHISSSPCSVTSSTRAWTQSSFYLIFTFALLALKYMQVQLKGISTMDPLTDLANSRYFLDVGAKELARAHRYKRAFSIIYIDIDDFRVINDSLGHQVGDGLLREIAKMAKLIIRKSDTVARLGGDEFALLLPETGEVAAKAAVARIIKRLSEIKAPDSRQITFSVGVITNTGQPGDFEDIVNIAKNLMHEVKHGGKNSVKYRLLIENRL